MKFRLNHRLTVCAAIVALIFSMIVPVYADTSLPNNTTYETLTFDDGSYVRIKTTEHQTSISLLGTTKSKSASRSYTYYESNNTKAWDFTITGTFEYDGSKAKATAVSTDYNIYVSSWKLVSRDASKNGASVSATGKFKCNLLSKSATIGLKCSANGTISSL